MLEYLRNAADKPVAKVLMGILIFSFVGWGVAEWIFGLSSSDTTLMRVGGDKVSIQQYSNMKSNELAGLSREEQRKIYTDPTAMAAFQDGVIKKIASIKRIEKHANDLGYVVSDHRIANEIREIPQFQEKGKFSPAAFDVVLRNSGLTESDVANDIRMRALSEMVNAPINTKIKTPRFAVRAAYNARGASRTVDVATVKFSEFDVVAPTEEQLREFYKQNPHRVAESRNISYVILSAEMDKPDEYEKNLKIAQKMEDDIIGGDTLAAAAKTHNAKFHKYENVTANKLPNDKFFDNAMIARVFDMDAGVESEMIETRDGFVIVRVDEITPEHTAEFDSVKKDLIAEWTRAERRKLAYVRANELLVDLNKTGKLANKKTINVTRTDGAAPAVLVAAFKESVGTNTIADDSDAFYVMHIANEKMPAVDNAKMESVRGDVSKMAAEHIRSDFDSYLEREYPIKINEKTYNRFVK